MDHLTLLGSAGAVFAIGTVFWAGATYSRIGAIEKRLTEIGVSIAKLGDAISLFHAVQRQADMNEKRIGNLPILQIGGILLSTRVNDNLGGY